MSSNRYNPKTRIVEFRQLWFIPQGRFYKKRLVRVRERAYTAGEIRNMARTSGFRMLAVQQQLVIERKLVRLTFLLEKRISSFASACGKISKVYAKD